jgi:hypothetical protein
MAPPVTASSGQKKRGPRSPGRRTYLVSILGRQPSKYDEERLRTLKADPRVLLWLETMAGNGLTVARRERRALKLREQIRGQSMRAIVSLIREPVQDLVQLFPGGGKGARVQALQRLREAVDSRGTDGKWESLKVHDQEGAQIVSLEAPKGGRLIVFVEREPHVGPAYGPSNDPGRPRLEGRKGSYDAVLGLVTMQLRGVSPSGVLIDATDLTVQMDGATLHLDDSSEERACPDPGFAQRIRVEPKSVGDWRWFCFSCPRLKDPPRGTDARAGIVKLKNLDGRTLLATVPIPDCIRDPMSPLFGLVPANLRVTRHDGEMAAPAAI